MSWRCSSSSNEGLIENLWENDLIKTQRVKDAFLKVDRADFSAISPYEDSPQRIGYDATISAPHIHAAAVEDLKDFLKPGSKALDIGSGSGYLCAVMAHLVSPGGSVTGIDHIPQLNRLAKDNLNKSKEHSSMLHSGIINIVTGDGRKGYAENGPYDAIHVGAAAAELHDELLDQLKAPGRMFIPVEEDWQNQYIWRIDKNVNGKVKKEKLYGVLFVPLTDRPKHHDDD